MVRTTGVELSARGAGVAGASRRRNLGVRGGAEAKSEVDRSSGEGEPQGAGGLVLDLHRGQHRVLKAREVVTAAHLGDRTTSVVGLLQNALHSERSHTAVGVHHLDALEHAGNCLRMDLTGNPLSHPDTASVIQQLCEEHVVALYADGGLECVNPICGVPDP